MGRALTAGLALAFVAGLLFVNHDTVGLSVAWPVILGFALWEPVGHRGARGATVALAAAIGVAFGYGTFAVVAELLPITATGLGLGVGVAVGVLVAAGLRLRDRLPLSALLVGYAAFVGVFEPRWLEAASSIRVHGFEDFTVALLGLLAGILATTLVRAVWDAVADAGGDRTRERGQAARDVLMRGRTS